MFFDGELSLWAVPPPLQCCRWRRSQNAWGGGRVAERAGELLRLPADAPGFAAGGLRTAGDKADRSPPVSPWLSHFQSLLNFVAALAYAYEATVWTAALESPTELDTGIRPDEIEVNDAGRSLV
jgi:hypothetical protein